MGSPPVSLEHLAGLPCAYAALADCSLQAACGTRFPVHKATLARSSRHALSLLSAAEDGEVASTGEADLVAALSAPLGRASRADVTGFLKLLYSMPNRAMLLDSLCQVAHNAGEPAWRAGALVPASGS